MVTRHERSLMFRDSALTSLLRLRWFIRMRFGMIAVALAVLAIEQTVVAGVSRPIGALLVILATAVVNCVWMVLSWQANVSGDISPDGHARTLRKAQAFANAQVAIDLLLLTLLLRYAGGMESGLAIFYLFHMGICALLLKPEHTLVQAAWAVLLYVGLGLGEFSGWIAPHYDFLPYFSSPGLYRHAGYVLVTGLVQATGVFGILYFTLRIARRFSEQEAQLRRALKALNASRQAIRDLQERRARFMSTAAHQLKSPLAAIQTMAGLIRDGYVRDDAACRTVESIVRRCREATTGVDELLTLARVQQADPHRHRTACTDVRAVLRQICDPRSAEARSKGLTFELDLPDDELLARIDARDLADMVDNLVENAIKYTPGPGLIRVRARAAHGPAESAGDEPAALIKLDVTDSGIGISEIELGGAEAGTVQGAIFDAYRRGNAAIASGIPGSGLGLSIVREVLEQAQGTIEVRSQVGSGSTFTVCLPAAVPPVAGERNPSELPSTTMEEITLSE